MLKYTKGGEDMEIRAKSKYNFDSVKALAHLTIFKKANPKKRMIFWTVVFAILLGIIILEMVVFGILDLIFLQQNGLLFLTISLLLFCYVLFAYKRYIKMLIKRDIEMHGKPIEVSVAVSDECIKQTQSTGSEFTLKYIDVKKVVKTKKYIYLQSKAKLLYSFKIDSFSVGSVEEFLKFATIKNE